MRIGLRLTLILLLCCVSLIGRAEWTGVAFEISDVDFDWEFREGVRTAKSNSLRLSFEESTESGLAVGGALGYIDGRIAGTETSGSTKFDAENLLVYLRQDGRIGDSVDLYGLFSYGYYNGRESGGDDPADVEWSETTVELGLGFRVNDIGLTPFVKYSDVDGDISGSDLNRDLSFELEEPLNYGLDINVYTDSTAYIGLRLQTGSQSGGYLSFVRRY